DINEVRDASAFQGQLPFALHPFYLVCDGVSMPDVHNGYFLDRASQVVCAQDFDLPMRIQLLDTTLIAVRVFGRDGGGNMFALGENDGAIYLLPNAGVESGTYFEDKPGVRRLAGGLIEFLWMLHTD